MRDFLERYRHSLRTKILISFCILFIFVAGCSIAGYSLTLRNINRLTIDSMEMLLNQVNVEASRILLSVQDRAMEVAEDAQLQVALRNVLPDTEQGIYQERLNFNNLLYYESIRVENIDSLYVIGENGMRLHSRHAFRNYNYDYREDDWYQQVITSKEVLWIEPHAGSVVGNNLDDLTISIVVPIQDKASPKLLGAVVADVLVEAIQEIPNSSVILDGGICILNNENEVIFMDSGYSAADSSIPAPEYINMALKDIGEGELDEINSLNINGESYLTGVLALSNSSWNLLCLIPTKEVLSQVEELRTLLFGASLLIVVLGVTFSLFASAYIVKPVQELQDGMKQVEMGDYTVRVKEDGQDEIGSLAKGFNHMIYRINESLENERIMQEKLKQADFNALQAQINPHFLYNTLDSINWMARFNQIDKVAEMIDSLTSFLRIGLSRGRVFISLSDELKHVESYFNIQKIRYQRLLSYSIHVPESMYCYKVIKMILQPMVENALDHGIREKDEPGLISITGEESENGLLLYVEDTGQGMTPERLAEVQEMMRSGVAQNQDAYGIINVQRRIQSYFGEEYGLTFESEYGKGTKITITLPKQEVQENHV